jgi:hypothetical protein
MSISSRFAKRYTVSGELEIVILKDDSGVLLSNRLGPYSVSTPPSSTEFPDWATLITTVEDAMVNTLDVKRVELSGPTTWTTDATIVSFNLKAILSDSSTLTDIDSVVTPIITGETVNYTAEQNGKNELGSGVILTVASGDTFIVEYMVSS